MSILTDKEVQAVLLAFLTGRGQGGATEEDMHSVISWAEGVRLDSALLQMAIDGTVLLDWQDGELVTMLREAEHDHEVKG